MSCLVEQNIKVCSELSRDDEKHNAAPNSFGACDLLTMKRCLLDASHHHRLHTLYL